MYTFPPGAAGMPLRQLLLHCLAIISLVGAIIHFAVSGEHFVEFWGFGVFMLGVAWLQLIWAIGLERWPTRVWLGLGAALNAIIVVVYAITRTVGDVIGPTPDELEPVGFGDLFCTVIEALAAVLAVILILRPADRVLPGRRALTIIIGVAAVAMVLLSIALVAGGPEMVMTGGDMS